MEWWKNGLVLSGNKLILILIDRPIPIFEPIFQNSNIPARYHKILNAHLMGSPPAADPSWVFSLEFIVLLQFHDPVVKPFRCF
jgi:hypothetical protein